MAGKAGLAMLCVMGCTIHQSATRVAPARRTDAEREYAISPVTSLLGL